MGLIDPVATGGYQMVGTNSTTVPSNVATVYVAYAGKTSWLGSVLFQSTFVQAEDLTLTRLTYKIFQYIHEEIGFAGDAPDVQAFLEAGARASGVPL